jgi:hypothetical protein
LERAPTELDYSRNKATSKSVTSPDNAAAALRRAKQQNDIYAHKSQTPLENLELLSGKNFPISQGVVIFLLLTYNFVRRRASTRSTRDDEVNAAIKE